jgi:hypothetical protein
MKNTFLGALAALMLTLTGCGSADGLTTVSDIRPVTVEAAPSVAQRIDAGGYDLVSSNIQSSFKLDPIPADYVANTVQVHFNRGISSENAVAEMKVRKLRPANLAECLAYGQAISTARKLFDLGPPNYYMVCLGSSAVVSGVRRVPVLDGWDGGWHLELGQGRGGWSTRVRFLAVAL